jgi:subtilisin family serine protease
MSPFELIGLESLAQRTCGRPDVRIGLVDGPVAMDHPDLDYSHLAVVATGAASGCVATSSTACQHGTFVAGILSARRGSGAPAICPDCTLLVRSIFSENQANAGGIPQTTPRALAAAILDCIDAGATIINLSVALPPTSYRSDRTLVDALDHAAKRQVIVVAAAGNQSAVGSSEITRHPWVIPVVAYDSQGRPLHHSNLGPTIGRRGIGAPGANVVSTTTRAPGLSIEGTSVAAPFVTGTIALLWSEYPHASAGAIRMAIMAKARRTTIVPPLLDAIAADRIMLSMRT